MKKFNKRNITVIAAIAVFAAGLFGAVINSPLVHAAPVTVDLQTAEPFAILAGTPGITNVGGSDINGNVGLSPASGAGITLLCAQVTGTIYTVDAAGPLPCRITNGPLLVTAKNHLTAAYDDAAGRTPVTTVPTELGGTTKAAGVYDSVSTTFGITAGAGPLVLDGQGDPSSVFIFNMNEDGTGLTVGPGSTVSLVNGAQACNVFWRLDTAAIDTTAVFKGNILALNSITVANGADIEGRLLARNGQVTLINDTISVPTCDDSDDGGSGSADDDVVPTLPNTGDSSEGKDMPWGIIFSAGVVVIALLSIFLMRKKRQN